MFLFPTSLSNILQSSYPAPNVNSAETGKTYWWPRIPALAPLRANTDDALSKGPKGQRLGQVVASEVSLKTALLLELERRSGVGPHSALQPPSWIRGFFLDPRVCWRRSKSPGRPSPGFGSGAQPRSDAAAQGSQSPLAGIGASLHPGIEPRAIQRGENTLRGGWAAAELEGQRDPQRESGVRHRAGAPGRLGDPPPGLLPQGTVALFSATVASASRSCLASLSSFCLPGPPSFPGRTWLGSLRHFPPLPLRGAHASPFARPRFLPLIFGSFRPSSALSVQRRLPPLLPAPPCRLVPLGSLRRVSAFSDFAATVRVFPPLPAPRGSGGLALSGQVLVSVGRGSNPRPSHSGVGVPLSPHPGC